MNKAIPTPQKPWQPTAADKVKNLLIVLTAFALAGASVELTGLNGKLGFFVSLFF